MEDRHHRRDSIEIEIDIDNRHSTHSPGADSDILDEDGHPERRTGMCTRSSTPDSDHHSQHSGTSHSGSSSVDISSKLSFGISRILNEPQKAKAHNGVTTSLSSHSHYERINSNSSHSHGRLSPPEQLSPNGPYPGLVGGSGFVFSPGSHPFGPGFPPGHVPPGFEGSHGVIKVPAHRPMLFSPHMNFSPLMFPWMQDRKDRLTGEYN